ncbi:MAG: nucleotidyltransferase domain-containing protein [Halobacteria archaeon]
MNLEWIKRDLEFLREYEVILYGSIVTQEFQERSDIDVAVITRNRDRTENIELLKSFLGKARGIYDIRIFELLPLKIQASAIASYKVLFGSELEIAEYLYRYRKLWQDCRHRILENQFKSYREKIEAMRRFEKWRSKKSGGKSK